MLACAACTSEREEPFSRLIVFGDSYSDSGNANGSTRGPNWLEYLHGELGLAGELQRSQAGGTNYAIGGATALGSAGAGLAAQVARERALHPVADPDALYVIWIGLNDIHAAEAVSEPEALAGQIVAAIARAMRDLQRRGARHFLVPGVWDLTTTPIGRSYPEEPRSELLALSLSFNAQLDAMLDAFPEPVQRLDAFALSREIAADAASFGFTKPAGYYCGKANPNCEGFVWRDTVHPTSATGP